MMIDKISHHQAAAASLRAAASADRGVDDVTHANWFGGIYQDPKNFFATWRSSPRAGCASTGVQLPDDQKKAWLADRTGAIVGANSRSDSAGRSATACRSRARSTGGRTAAPGSSPSTASTIGEQGRRQDAILLPLRLPERESASQSDGRDQVGWYMFKIDDPVAGADDRARRSTRCSRTRRPRPRRPPKRRSSPASPSRSATSARS